MSETDSTPQGSLFSAQERFLLLNVSDAIPAPIFYKDAELKYIGFNRAFENFLSSNKQKIEHETALPEGKTGGIRDFFVVKGKYYNADGSLRGVIANLFDVTDRKKLENSLLQAKEKVGRCPKKLERSFYSDG